MLGLQAKPVEVGAPAPVAPAVNEEGQPVDLAKLYAKGTVLVYFYPRADTPGCTAQACSLRDAYEALQEQGVTVIGVSSDSPARQKAFKEKHKLPFTLLADQDGKVAAAFGVPVRAGFTSRQAFLMRDGKVVWRDLSASTRQQAEDVKKALASLPKASS